MRKRDADVADMRNRIANQTHFLEHNSLKQKNY